MVRAQQLTPHCPTGWGAPLLQQKTSTYSPLSIPSLSWLRLCSLCVLQAGAPLQGCPMGLHPDGMYPDGMYPDGGAARWGCILMGCILMGCISMGRILLGCIPMGCILLGCTLLGCTLVGFILPGFILLYVRLWQTGGDVVLQDFSFQPQKAGCCQKSVLGVSLARVPPRSPLRTKERGAMMHPSFLLHFKINTSQSLPFHSFLIKARDKKSILCKRIFPSSFGVKKKVRLARGAERMLWGRCIIPWLRAQELQLGN